MAYAYAEVPLMGMCNNCQRSAPTVIAYGTQVCCACGWPLVGERALRTREVVEDARLAAIAREREDAQRIRELERKLSEVRATLSGFRSQADELARLERMLGRAEDHSKRVCNILKVLSRPENRPIMALVSVLCKELGATHTVAQNMAVESERGRPPVGSGLPAVYHALGDVIRYGLRLTIDEMKEALDAAQFFPATSERPVGASEDEPGEVGSAVGGAIPGIQLDEDDGVQPGSEGAVDDGAGAAKARDLHDFWTNSK